MRAVSYSSFGGPDVLELVDVEVPTPGPGQIRIAVRACGVNPFDHKQRRGLFGGEPPIRVGLEVAGVVDEIGAGSDDHGGLAVGDSVYGFAIGGGAADFTLSTEFAAVPAGVDLVTAAALPVAVETAYRVLDLLAVAAGTTLVVNGASGAVGQAIVQVATARGVRVIGTASEANHPLLRELGALPLTYGIGLVERVQALDDPHVDAAVDAGGGGALAGLVELTGDPQQVVTINPDQTASALGVRVSAVTSAFHALTDVAALIEAGQFRPAPVTTFALDEVGDAQEASESGHTGGTKLVLTL